MPTALEWELHKSAIERIYMLESKTLAQLRAIMESTLNFRASKAQYERKLKQWCFKKNTMKEKDWKYISRRIAKRKKERGKESEVYLHGVQLMPSKIQKETARYNFVSTVEKFYSQALSPKTPEGILVCSPGPSPATLEWDQSLPWFRFLRFFEQRIHQSGSREISLFPVGPNARTESVTFSDYIDPSIAHRTSTPFLNFDISRCPSFSENVSKSLGSVLQWSSTHLLQNIRSSSRVATVLSVIMPEEYEGQHLTIARRLCNSKEDTVLLDGLKIKFFLLSNNFTFQKYDSSGDISPENVEAYDELMIGLVKKVGLNSVNDFKLLLSNGRTAEAVAEQLFASAIRSGQLEIVKMMLEAGMNPNSSMDSIISNSLLTALEYATGCYRKATSIRMTGAYLSQQTIDQLEVDEEKDLDDTAKKKHIELMNILIAAGAHATPISLHFAIVSGDAILMQILLDAGADVNGRAYIKSGADKDLTALGRAICQRNVRIAQILIANGANVDQLQRHNESPLDLAAMKGDVSMLELLLDSHANVNPPLLRHSLFLSPLDRAVSFCPKNSEAWKLLLNAGANICSADGRLEARLLVSAVSEGNTELCGILLAHGAKVYLNEAGLRHYSKPLLLFAAESGNVGTLSILLSHGAHVNAVGVRDGKTALGTAIEFGNCEMIHILWQAGATIIGNIDRIGNTETANILARTGLLPDVVWQHGSKMLADAIWEDNQDLIRSILSYEMHFDASSGVLEAAILVGSMELVEDLIRRGAKFTVRSLHATVYKALGTGDDSIVRRFLGFYSELSHVDHADSTAIAMVIQKGNLNLLQLLLEAGIDPRGALPKGYDFTNGKRHCINWRTPYYWDYSPEYASSVLEVAAKKGDQSFLRVLLTATTWDQESAGFALTVAIENSNYHLVEDLLEIGADLDVDVPLDNLTLNSLQLAIEAQQIPLICTLLQAGANINHLGSGDFSRTALQAAVETGNLELLDLLLDAGGNVNSPPAAIGGATALQIAACKGFLAITRKLLSAGAKINAKKARVDGRTALEGAAEHGRIDMLYLLLNEGASIQNRGRTQYIRAVKFAETSGHYAAAKLLKSVGGWTESDKLQYDKEDISDKFGAEGWRRDYGTADQFSSEDISDSDSEIVGNSTNDDMMESINEVWDEFTEGFGGFTESSDWLTAEGLAEF